MTSSLPPRLRDTRSIHNRVRQDRANLKNLATGFMGGRFPLRPLGRPFSDGEEDDSDDDPIKFYNRDQGVCAGSNVGITIRLTQTPEDGSEQVFYNGTPLKRGDWTRTDTFLTIPGESWFRAGKVAWVNYAYYDQELDVVPAAFVATSFVTGDHSSIAIPAGTVAGDTLVLVMCARATAAPVDARFSDPGFTDTVGGFGKAGVWVGVSDGSGAPVAINMVSAGVGDPADGVAALMTITGTPLTLTADQGSLTSPLGTDPFTSTSPATQPGFGMAAVFGVSGILSGSISEQTSNWTQRLAKQGGGAGKCSIYLATAAGAPVGTWYGNGSTLIGGARIMGVQ